MVVVGRRHTTAAFIPFGLSFLSHALLSADISIMNRRRKRNTLAFLRNRNDTVAASLKVLAVLRKSNRVEQKGTKQGTRSIQRDHSSWISDYLDNNHVHSFATFRRRFRIPLLFFYKILKDMKNRFPNRWGNLRDAVGEKKVRPEIKKWRA